MQLFLDVLKYGVCGPALGYVTAIGLHNLIVKEPEVLPSEVRYLGRESKFCLNCVHAKKACSKHCSYATLLWMTTVIDSATTSLDVCMDLITYKEFSDAIIRAKNRGCEVRVITARIVEDTSAMLLELRQALIPVRTMIPPPGELMDMKFATIDKEIVLTGSVNYTIEAFKGTSEEIVCMRDLELASSFVESFELIWDDFNFVDDTFNQMQFHNKVDGEISHSVCL